MVYKRKQNSTAGSQVSIGRKEEARVELRNKNQGSLTVALTMFFLTGRVSESSERCRIGDSGRMGLSSWV